MLSTRVSDLPVTVAYTDSGRWAWTVAGVTSGVDVNFTGAVETAILTATRYALTR